MRWWQRLIVNTILFLALAGFFSGFYIDHLLTAIIASIIFSILNIIVKPILVIISLPITILTLGFFYLIVNGFILWLTSAFVYGFGFTSFWWAVLVAIIISLVNSFLTDTP